VDLDEILCGGDDFEDYIYYIVLNLVPSTIPKWRTFNLRRAQILKCLVDLDEILYGDYDIEGVLDSIVFNPVALPF
jgi:hypothetical protein